MFNAPQFLHKRLKRQIKAGVHRFYVQCSPGLEEVCQSELAALGLNANTVQMGVLRFSGSLEDCEKANLACFTATRVLWEIADIPASGFPQFEKHFSEIPWELYLNPLSKVKIKVFAEGHASLYHKRAVEERVKEYLRKAFAAVDLETYQNDPNFGERASSEQSQMSQTLFLYMQKHSCRIRLDSSGERLEKRGLQKVVGPAPLRDTIASGILQLAFRDFSLENSDSIKILDSMSGSGTFTLEGLRLAYKNQFCAFPTREFAFEGWPGFRRQSYEFLKRSFSEQENSLKISKIEATDSDSAAINRIQKNLESLDVFLESCEINKSNAGSVKCMPKVSVAKKEFFQALPSTSESTEVTLVVLNPPWGGRLESDNASQLTKQIAKRVQELLSHNEQLFFSILVPEEFLATFEANLQLQTTLRTHLLRSGGISLKLLNIQKKLS